MLDQRWEGNEGFGSYFWFFDFIGSEAAFLSKSTIFAGAFANLMFIALKRDPNEPNKLKNGEKENNEPALLSFFFSNLLCVEFLKGSHLRNSWPALMVLGRLKENVHLKMIEFLYQEIKSKNL